MDWREEIKRMQNIPKLKGIMDDNIRKIPDFYAERMRLLGGFFTENSSPVDIVLILYGALSDNHLLAHHLEGNNPLFYRPKASHKRVIKNSFLEGNIHPERTLLMFDGDMKTGAAMRETAEFFTIAGYERSKMFGYLDEGCKWRHYHTPELMQVDDLLKKN